MTNLEKTRMTAEQVEVATKPWGQSTRVLLTKRVQVERIDVMEGGFSSIHLHQEKHNLFHVTRGRLAVRWFNESLMHYATNMLFPGQSLHVYPGHIHQFQADTDVEAIETYFTDERQIDPDDIERFSQNGIYVPVEPRKPAMPLCCVCNRPIDCNTSRVVSRDGAFRHVCGKCYREPISDGR